MKRNVELIQRHIDYLTSQPEEGMGYQIVEITLRTGEVVKHRMVLNSMYLILEEHEEIASNDIASIILEQVTND